MFHFSYIKNLQFSAINATLILLIHSFTLNALLLSPFLTFLSLDNPAMASQTSVSVRILDVNDNPPELATPYEASICEDAKPGQVR